MKFTRRAPYVAHTLCATIIVMIFTGTQTLLVGNAAHANSALGTQENAVNEGVSAVTGDHAKDDGVANLPYARGAIFNCLDDYLAHLEANGAIDLPYWREIEPGVYERVTTMVGREREIATRDVLMQRFGFTC